jgi:hypothetical protein
LTVVKYQFRPSILIIKCKTNNNPHAYLFKNNVVPLVHGNYLSTGEMPRNQGESTPTCKETHLQRIRRRHVDITWILWPTNRRKPTQVGPCTPKPTLGPTDQSLGQGGAQLAPRLGRPTQGWRQLAPAFHVFGSGYPHMLNVPAVA